MWGLPRHVVPVCGFSSFVLPFPLYMTGKFPPCSNNQSCSFMDGCSSLDRFMFWSWYCNFWTAHRIKSGISDEIRLGDHWCGSNSDRVNVNSTPAPSTPVRINSPLRELRFPLSGPAASVLFQPELWWWFTSYKRLQKSGLTQTFHCNLLFNYCSFFGGVRGGLEDVCAREWTKVDKKWEGSLAHNNGNKPEIKSSIVWEH